MKQPNWAIFHVRTNKFKNRLKLRVLFGNIYVGENDTSKESAREKCKYSDKTLKGNVGPVLQA
jgi:hypothetical protein